MYARIIQVLSKVVKVKSLGDGGKGSIKPVFEFYKSAHLLGLNSNSQQDSVLSMRIKMCIDALDYVGEGHLARQLEDAFYSI